MTKAGYPDDDVELATKTTRMVTTTTMIGSDWLAGFDLAEKLKVERIQF